MQWETMPYFRGRDGQRQCPEGSGPFPVLKHVRANAKDHPGDVYKFPGPWGGCEMDQAQSILAAPSAWYLLPGLWYALTNAFLDLGERTVIGVGYATSCWNSHCLFWGGCSCVPLQLSNPYLWAWGTLASSLH